MKCPGQDTQYWNADAVFDVKCPQCSELVEFFKDDTTRRCRRCGHRFVNPRMDFGCAAYCQYAEQCLGDLPPELVAQQEDLLKDRVAVAVKRHLKTDFKRIGHITRRARHAEQLAKQADAGERLPVVLITAYLWDLDSGDLDSGDLDSGDIEADTPVAQTILTDLRAPPPLIEQVCKIVARRHSANPDGPDPVSTDDEFKIVAEAEQMALAEETTHAE